MSTIPSAKLQIAATPYGSSAKAQNVQFGNVELTSDGKVDDAFRSSEQKQYDLADVAGFIEKQHQLASQSLSDARTAFESGTEFDKFGKGDEHRKALKDLSSETEGVDNTYPKTDWRGVLTSTSANLEGSDGRSNGQRLEISNGPQGTIATLETRKGDAVHKMSVPVGEDGKVHLEDSTESVELTTPWISQSVAGRVSSRGIKSIEDARLARVADAAQMGFHLAPGELGEGWEANTEGAKQTLSVYNQKVVIDSADRSFEVHAKGSFTGHAGSGDDVGTDYEVKNSLKWKDGRFERLPN